MWRGSVTTHQSSIHGVVSMHGRFCRWRFKASAPTGLSTTFDGGIWAEAVTAEATGEALTIDPALWDEAAERADARLPDDPWQDISWPGSRLCPTQASNGSAARSESRQNSSSKMYLTAGRKTRSPCVSWCIRRGCSLPGRAIRSYQIADRALIIDWQSYRE
jgi:hypothetical protein